MHRPTLIATALAACLTTTAAPAAASDIVESEAATFRIDKVADGLELPWAMAFLPDGRLLVSERAAGRLSTVDPRSGEVERLEAGPDDVYVKDNAGMLDVILHPDYPANGWFYFAYTAGDERLNTTVVERARLAGNRIVDRQRLFDARPWYHNSIVYGCRLAIRDGYLFVTMGDRWDLRHLSQSPGSHLGKILRLHDDGRVPADNPWAGLAGAEPAVWALGVRNPQGLALHPVTGELWEHEHGPLGGDEVNVIRRGRNYGWPVITYGKEYSGEPVGDGITHQDGMEQPLHYYVPSIAPSGMTFYAGDAFPAWRGSLFIGALAKTHLNRLVVADAAVVHEERLLADRGWRVRAVNEGPEGFLYLAIDDGAIYRLVPAAR